MASSAELIPRSKFAKPQVSNEHQRVVDEFVSEQERFNAALDGFRRRFESGDPDAIIEYCETVFEASDYPSPLTITHSVEFDRESLCVIVNAELPDIESIPSAAGYKFVSRGNKAAPNTTGRFPS